MRRLGEFSFLSASSGRPRPSAVVCFGLLGWATVLTYRDAPPLPAAIVDSTGKPLMTHDDIVAGKGGFQKADLMDYGSIYGMGRTSARTTPPPR